MTNSVIIAGTYDTLAKSIAFIYESANKGVAWRQYQEFIATQKEKTRTFNENDYQLWQLAELDKYTKEITQKLERIDGLDDIENEGEPING